jgi:hypothetical protein
VRLVELACGIAPEVPVHLRQPADPGLLKQILYRIDDLAELPVLEPLLSAGRAEKCVHILRSLAREALRGCREILLGPLDEPAVEGWVDCLFVYAFQIVVPEQANAGIFD